MADPELLIRRCQAGDDGAFVELYRRHRSDVARLVQRLLGRAADVEDVTQEVFLQVSRSLKDFRYGARFSTWLYRVTLNVVLMQRRAERSRPVLVDGGDELVPEDASPLPDEQIARGRRVRALLEILDGLSEKKRTAYVLHDLEGMRPADIARAVGAPVLTVRTRLFSARREIAGRLREEPSLRPLAAWLERRRRSGDRQSSTTA